jgi:hypothetical protein
VLQLPQQPLQGVLQPLWVLPAPQRQAASPLLTPFGCWITLRVLNLAALPQHSAQSAGAAVEPWRACQQHSMTAPNFAVLQAASASAVDPSFVRAAPPQLSPTVSPRSGPDHYHMPSDAQIMVQHQPSSVPTRLLRCMPHHPIHGSWLGVHDSKLQPMCADDSDRHVHVSCPSSDCC